MAAARFERELNSDDPKVRIKANEGLIRLYGLQAPQRILVGDMDEEQLAQEEKRLGLVPANRISPSTNGNGCHTNNGNGKH